VTATHDAAVGFKDCNFGMLVVPPRGRAWNVKISCWKTPRFFSARQGSGCGRQPRRARAGGSQSANTNSLIAQRNARPLPPNRFTAMTRLDHNRDCTAHRKSGAPLAEVKKIIIWGTIGDPIPRSASRDRRR